MQVTDTSEVKKDLGAISLLMHTIPYEEIVEAKEALLESFVTYPWSEQDRAEYEFLDAALTFHRRISERLGMDPALDNLD